MNRVRATAVVLGTALGASLAMAYCWPGETPALPCHPSEVVAGADGIARCRRAGEPRRPLPAGQALTIGQPLDLNAATAEELAEIPGVGPELAAALVAERVRRGRFGSWDEVDQVSGVGPARLQGLQASAEIRESDGGL